MSWENKDAGKRKPYPDREDYEFEYCLDTHLGYDRHCLRDKRGWIVHIFKDEEDMKLHKEILILFGWEIMRRLEDKVGIHKREHPGYYNPTYEEANFVHKALIRSFEVKPESYTPYNNWFGVSLYEPDAIFRRGDKTIILSLQGVLFRHPGYEMEGYEELLKSRAVKYICFKKGGEELYVTHTGILPDNNFIETFLSEE